MLIQNVISYISENYQENISLNDAAKKVFLSPSYLSTLVTSETGKSFTDILNETRIQKAIQLLKDPTRKIAEVENQFYKKVAELLSGLSLDYLLKVRVFLKQQCQLAIIIAEYFFIVRTATIKKVLRIKSVFP